MAGKLKILRAPKGDQKDVSIDGPITIGRASDNDVVLRDKGVSRHHCVIEPFSGGVRVRDVGSSLGTYVNRQRVTEQLLRDGDRILLGKSRLRYVAQITTAGRNGVAVPDLAFEDDEPIQVTEADDSAAPLPIDPEDSALPIDDEPAVVVPTDNDEVDEVGLANALGTEDKDLSVEGVFDADDSDLEHHADDAEYVESGTTPENAAILTVADELSDSPALTPDPADEVNASIASDEHAHREELKAAETRADELQESLETAESRAAELEVNFLEAETRAAQATGECSALQAEHASCEAEYQRLLSLVEEQLAIARDEDAAARAQNVETTEALKTALAEAEAETNRLCEVLAEAETVAEENTQTQNEQERQLEAARIQREQAESVLRQKIADVIEAAADKEAESESHAKELASLHHQIESMTDETARETAEHMDRVAALEAELSELRQAAKNHDGQLVELENAAGSERERAEQIAEERVAFDKARIEAESVVAELQAEMEQLAGALQARESTRAEFDELKERIEAVQETETAHALRQVELEREVDALQEERKVALESHQLSLDQREQRIDELEREVIALREKLSDQRKQHQEMPHTVGHQEQLEVMATITVPEVQYSESGESQPETTRASLSEPEKRLPKNFEDRDLLAWIAIGVLVIALLALGGFSVIRLFLT